MLLLRLRRFFFGFSRCEFVLYFSVWIVRLDEVFLGVVRLPPICVVVGVGRLVSFYAGAVVTFCRIFNEVFVGVVMRYFSPVFKVLSSRRERRECPLSVVEGEDAYRLGGDEYVVSVLCRFHCVAFPIRSLERARCGQDAREFLVRGTFVGPAVFTRVGSLVKDVGRRHVIRRSLFFRVIGCAPCVVVREFRYLRVIARVPLGLPINRFFSF